MKKNSRSLQQSRRKFTKAAFTALASAPVAPSVIAAQGDKSSATEKQQVRTDHIPPLTIRGGSLALELLHELKDTSGGSTTRPEHYLARGVTGPSGGSEGTQYGSIAKMQVVTESLSDSSPWTGSFRVDTYPESDYFDEARRVELWLWFVQLPYTANDPHMKFKGGVPVPGQALQTLLIESDKRLDKKKSHSLKRGWKYKHKGHDNEDYRIKEWRLVEGSGAEISRGADAESYMMMVEFHHGT